MKVRRVVSVYDLISDKLIKEISIDDIPIVELRTILNVDKNDLDVYQVYPISYEQLSKFINFIPELSDLSIDNAGLYVECFQD
jgi:hypothetical protein